MNCTVSSMFVCRRKIPKFIRLFFSPLWRYNPKQVYSASFPVYRPHSIRKHTYLHSLELLWRKDRPVAEIPTWQNTGTKRDSSPFQTAFPPERNGTERNGSVCYRIIFFKCSYNLSGCHFVPTKATLNCTIYYVPSVHNNINIAI